MPRLVLVVGDSLPATVAVNVPVVVTVVELVRVSTKVTVAEAVTLPATRPVTTLVVETVLVLVTSDVATPVAMVVKTAAVVGPSVVLVGHGVVVTEVSVASSPGQVGRWSAGSGEHDANPAAKARQTSGRHEVWPRPSRAIGHGERRQRMLREPSSATWFFPIKALPAHDTPSLGATHQRWWHHGREIRRRVFTSVRIRVVSQARISKRRGARPRTMTKRMASTSLLHRSRLMYISDIDFHLNTILRKC
jgi:hypothetical protein